MTRQKLLYLMLYYVEKQVFWWRAKEVQICCLITWKSRFSHVAPKILIFDALLRWKAVFSWCAKKVQICCIITWKSRFSHDAPKSLIFYALLRGKAGFLMTRQKGANLLHYYVSKQVFSWRAKNSYICCLITWKSRFSHDAPKRCKFVALLRRKAGFLMMCQKGANLLHYYVEKQVFSWHVKKVQICCITTFRSSLSHDAPKRCKFIALLRRKAGFLMTRQNLLYLMHNYVEKQVFSWHAKKVQISCIITFRSRFSHDAPKTLIFDQYYVEKQVFSWRAKKVQICCLIMWKSRFSHVAPKTLIFNALLRFEAVYLMTRQKGANLLHYYVEKQVFSWHAKNSYTWCIITWKSRFSHDVPKSANLLPYYMEKQVFS